MRKTLFFLSVVILLTGCQKELHYNVGNGATIVNGVLKMKIDGNQWVADKVAGASIISGVIAIAGTSNSKKHWL